jgi:hypothetical protein
MEQDIKMVIIKKESKGLFRIKITFFYYQRHYLLSNSPLILGKIK